METEKKKNQAPKKLDYAPSGFFAFRTALLPFQSFLDWGKGLQSVGALESGASESNERLDQSLQADRTLLRERLKAIIQSPEIREAIFVASPSLDEAVERWIQEPESAKGKVAEQSLIRYFSRMSGRSTPFGLFAGCSVGAVGANTRMEVQSLSAYRRHTRLDTDYLFALAEDLVKDPKIRKSLRYRANSSLYQSAGRLRYAEARLSGKSRSYHLVAVDPSDYLLATLERARGGASFEQLASALVGADITREDADGFIHELIDSQILVSELAPAVTGAEPIHGFIASLRASAETESIAKILETTQQALEKIDSSPLGCSKDAYMSIGRELEKLPTKVELSRLFQVDMTKPSTDATFGQPAIDEIVKGVGMLQMMSNYARQDSLTRFAQQFWDRYEQREVPLVEALDEESGIGFNRSGAPSAEASPLLEGAAFPTAGGDNLVNWNRKEEFLLQKVVEAEKRGDKEIVLTDEDLPHLLAGNPRSLPDAFAVMGMIGSKSQADIDKGDFQVYISSCGGPSGANLLGRFCHGDPKLLESVKRHIAEEEALAPDTVFAEVVHLPEGRVGNVLLRPLLRSYEIPFLGRSGAPSESWISVDDLLVSVRGDQIFLRSRRLGKRVLPRLSSAHGYFSERNLGLYRFLGALQWQGVAGGLSWDWGPLDGFTRLPRVRYSKVILSRARWTVLRTELDGVFKAKGKDRFRLVQEWRKKRDLPRLVRLVDFDNELTVDFENIFCIESFLEEVEKRQGFLLKENFPGQEELCAFGPEGRFVSEFVVPFVKKKEAVPSTNGHAMPVAPPSYVHRNFPPGSEWLFLKIYTGTATADQLLNRVVEPLVSETMSSKKADKWFFIRYGDPEWHLRLRFHGKPADLNGFVLSRFHELISPFLSDGSVAKIQLDTYEPEVERYGGEVGVPLAEKLFEADSRAALSVVQSITGDALADARWKLALLSINQLLEDFGLDLQAKYQFEKKAREAFGTEFRADASYLKHTMGQKFRKERKALEAMLASPPQPDSPLGLGWAALQRRSEEWKPTVKALQEAAKNGKLSSPLEDLLSSYAHMLANRMLRASQRAQELFLHDFLLRIYESRLAREGKLPSPKAGDSVEPER